MTSFPAEDAARLNRDAMQALSNRQSGEARRLLNQALQLDPSLLSAWMNLAVAQRVDGDVIAALASIDQARKINPLFFPAQLMRGSLLEQMGKTRQAAASYEIALTLMPPEDSLDPPTRRAVAHAIEFHSRNRIEMESFLRREMRERTGASAEARRMSHFLDHLVGQRKIYHSAPTNLYYPGLPSIEVYDRDLFPWLPGLEAATPLIQAELAGVFEDEAAVCDIEPYTQLPEGEPLDRWAELNHSTRWSAYHFAFYGKAYDAHRRKCPNTVALIDSLPQPQVQNRSPASMFSILQPKTHIPAHNGVANFRLLCHLPLILPPDCRFRVGNSLLEWRMNEAFVFDDTIEHEAWNDSDQMRTVLIFDIWHPFLGDAERDFITRSLVAIDRFNEAP